MELWLKQPSLAGAFPAEPAGGALSLFVSARAQLVCQRVGRAGVHAAKASVREPLIASWVRRPYGGDLRALSWKSGRRGVTAEGAGKKEAIDDFGKSYLLAEVFRMRTASAYAALSDEAFHARPRWAKSLIEEVFPISAFLGAFSTPGRTVRCRHYSGSQPFDARIKVEGEEVSRGMLRSQFDVEVTVAEPRYEYLVREALREGRGCFDPRAVENRLDAAVIRQEGIPATGLDVKEMLAMNRNMVVERVKAKADKGYSPPPILLVVAPLGRRRDLDDWALMARAVRDSGAHASFAFVYLVDWAGSTVVPI